MSDNGPKYEKNNEEGADQFLKFFELKINFLKNEFEKSEEILNQYSKKGVDKSNYIAMIECKKGNFYESQKIIDSNYKNWGTFANTTVAQVYAACKKNSLALDALEAAYKIGDNYLIDLYADPGLEPLRKEPRFIHLYKKMGFK